MRLLVAQFRQLARSKRAMLLDHRYKQKPRLTAAFPSSHRRGSVETEKRGQLPACWFLTPESGLGSLSLSLSLSLSACHPVWDTVLHSFWTTIYRERERKRGREREKDSTQDPRLTGTLQGLVV